MKVLIVSDTHGRDENLEIVINREAPFDMLVHCGDVEGREFYIEALAECPCSIVSLGMEQTSFRNACVPAALCPEIMIFSRISREKM